MQTIFFVISDRVLGCDRLGLSRGQGQPGGDCQGVSLTTTSQIAIPFLSSPEVSSKRHKKTNQDLSTIHPKARRDLAEERLPVAPVLLAAQHREREELVAAAHRRDS